MPTMPIDLHAPLHHGWLPALAAYAIALALSLVLAAWLTPRHWWRRPTLRGAAVLAAGTLAFGSLFLALAGRAQPAQAAQASAASLKKTPTPGAHYRVVGQLNLRTGSGVHAARVAVLPAGSRVTAGGAVDGDWWQVRADVDGRVRSGWTSSLWLRQVDER